MTSIGGSAFYNCKSLTTVSFPNAKSIGASAFASCAALTTASFPNVTSIGAYAFRYCSALESLYFITSNVPTLGASAFLNTPLSVSTLIGHFGSIYVPQSLLASFKAATNWKAYSARMVGV